MDSDQVARVAVPGPLGPYAAGFREELARLGYTTLSAIVHLRLMARLSRWLAEQNVVDVRGLTAMRVEAFFAERRSAGYTASRTSRSVQPLLAYLHRIGVVSPSAPPPPATPAQAVLARYAEYLRLERGLADQTVALNVRLVHDGAIA